jgi:MerR family transcriptional regulator/heat shock protein HspR
MDTNYKEPLYTIGIVAKLLGVCCATLRIWEKNGLIKPDRIGKNRYYSKANLDQLEHVKKLIQEKGINIEGVKVILNTLPCWEIKNCPPKVRNSCPVFKKKSK